MKKLSSTRASFIALQSEKGGPPISMAIEMKPDEVVIRV